MFQLDLLFYTLQEYSEALPVRKSNQELAIFRLLTRRCTNKATADNGKYLKKLNINTLAQKCGKRYCSLLALQVPKFVTKIGVYQ